MIFQPEQFATASLRRLPRGDDICRILAAAINSANAQMAIHKHVELEGNRLLIADQSFSLELYRRIYVIAAGKAAVPMAAALFKILGDRITTGLVITKTGYLGPVDDLRNSHLSIVEAAHPIPDQSNLAASSLLAQLLHDLNSNDLVFCLLSGGGSALLMKPVPGISLTDIKSITRLLLSSGADISEINTIRKHLDEFKGGGLANLLFPATIVSLIISDVIGDSLESVASGPTVADPTTFQDAWTVFNKYQLLDQIPSSITKHIQDGMLGNVPETKKPGNRVFDSVRNVIVANNAQCAHSAIQAAEQLGFAAQLLTTSLQGEASQAGRSLAENAKSMFVTSHATRPACLVAGGETVVTVHGAGLGGRNQELALGAVKSLAGDRQLVLVSLATDGGDGPTDAAGAVVTNHTYANGLSMGLDPDIYLANNDSYHYFEPMGDLLKTGPTLTNVNDLVFIFAL